MSDLQPGAEWQRLDPRMLLVHPIRELVRFLPILVGVVVAGEASSGGSDGRPPWQYLSIAIPIVLGVLRYVTTGFRLADGRVELRSGLVNRRVLSTPLDRVRTVDLTASPIHRLLGVTTLRIGTGGDSEKLDLDGLAASSARLLREDLLGGAVSAPTAQDDPFEPPLVTFDLSWLRFAPFTGAGLAVAAATLGAVSQVLNTFDAWDDVEDLRLAAATGVVVMLGLLTLIAVIVVITMLGYLVTNGGFRLSRTDTSWHIVRGLLTTRETTLDVDRVAGVRLGEPLLLRAAGGRQLSALVTGVDRKDVGSATLVPATPREIAPRVAAVVLGTSAPLEAPLRDHGPAARRRRWVRALVPAALVLLVAGAATLAGGPWWLPVPAALVVAAAAYVGHDRATGLGHTLVEGYVVAQSGSLARSREVLASDHVIGWTLRATWFQRRQGLTTLVATTASGRGAVTIIDLPEVDAERLAGHAVPALIDQFVTTTYG